MNNFSTIGKLAGERAVDLVANNHVFTVQHETPLDFLSKFALALPAQDVNEMSLFGDSPEFQKALVEQADFLANIVGTHRDFACNVASPAVQAAVEKARELIAAIEMNATAGFNLLPTAAAAFLSDSDFQTYVSRFYNGTYHMDLTTNYPLYTHDQIVGILQSNDSINHAMLNDLLEQLPAGYLDVIWQSVFLSKTMYTPTVRVEQHHELLTDYMNGGNSAVVIFLLAATLFGNITDDAGMSLESAQAALLEMAATAAHYVRRAHEYTAEMRQGGYMVQQYDREGRVVKLDAELYKQWQEAGGKPEVLLGALISDKSPRTLDAINGMADVLLEEWDLYVRSRQSEMDSAFYTQVMTVLRQVFRDSIESGNLLEPEAEQLAKPGARAKAEAIFLQHLDSVTASELRKDWVNVFWRALARGRFFYTNAYEILSDIDYEITERKADPDDAATTAMMNEVARFMASMMVCRPSA